GWVVTVRLPGTRCWFPSGSESLANTLMLTGDTPTVCAKSSAAFGRLIRTNTVAGWEVAPLSSETTYWKESVPEKLPRAVYVIEPSGFTTAEPNFGLELTRTLPGSRC